MNDQANFLSHIVDFDDSKISQSLFDKIFENMVLTTKIVIILKKLKNFVPDFGIIFRVLFRI